MLKDDVKRYIELKYALGFKYRVQASLLNSFAAFAKFQGDRFVRTHTLLIWAAKAPLAPQRRNRLLTLFSLLAATGLLISEALMLKLPDITDDGLIIRSTKFCKSRLVPIHETVRHGLDRYLSRRKHIGAGDNAIFVSLRGTALKYSTVNSVFLNLVRSIGLHRGPGNPGPTERLANTKGFE